MKVFVTGIAGFLGSHIAECLLAEGHEVVGVDNLIGGDIHNVPVGAAHYHMDCCDDLTDIMRGCEVVYHTAAYPHEGFSVFSPHTITRSVYDASVSVFTSAIRAGVRRIIHCSSMSRYGANITPFREFYFPAPQDPYAIAKVAAEQTLECLAKVHGIEYVIAVPHNIVGRRQKYDDPFRNVVAIMANLALQGRQIIIYGDGQQTRCFSHIDDVTPCLLRMMDHGTGEVINIGPDDGAVTIQCLAEIVAEQCNSRLSFRYFPDRPQEVKHATCSADKARALLGYEPFHGVDDCVDDIVSWIRQNGTRPFNYYLPLEIDNDKTPVTWKNRLF